MRRRTLVPVALLVMVVSLGGCTPPGPVADDATEVANLSRLS